MAPFQLTCAGSSVCHLESGLSTQRQAWGCFSEASWCSAYTARLVQICISAASSALVRQEENVTPVCLSTHHPSLLGVYSGQSILPDAKETVCQSCLLPSTSSSPVGIWRHEQPSTGQDRLAKPSCICSCPTFTWPSTSLCSCTHSLCPNSLTVH